MKKLRVLFVVLLAAGLCSAYMVVPGRVISKPSASWVDEYNANIIKLGLNLTLARGPGMSGLGTTTTTLPTMYCYPSSVIHKINNLYSYGKSWLYQTAYDDGVHDARYLLNLTQNPRPAFIVQSFKPETLTVSFTLLGSERSQYFDINVSAGAGYSIKNLDNVNRTYRV